MNDKHMTKINTKAEQLLHLSINSMEVCLLLFIENPSNVL